MEHCKGKKKEVEEGRGRDKRGRRDRRERRERRERRSSWGSGGWERRRGHRDRRVSMRVESVP